MMDPGWPEREGAEHYSALVSDDACLVALAGDGDGVIGHLIGKLSGPDSLRTGRVAVLENMRVAPDSRGAGVGGLLMLRFYAQHGFVAKNITSRAVL